MPSFETQNDVDLDSQKLRDEWLDRLSALVDLIETWAAELGWATRRIEKQMHDGQLGAYRGAALLLQKETTRALLEPIARSAPGVEGVVDLYRMPAYDDIASLYHHDGSWELRYVRPGTPGAAAMRNIDSEPLSKEALHRVLDQMQQNGA